MADLRTRLCGIELANPLIVSSGPLTWSARGIRRCFEAGAAAAVTKTIARAAAVNPTPHITGIGRGSLLNTEKWADLPASQWIKHELPALASADGVVIASVGHTAQEVEALARDLVRAGADMLEVVSYRAADMVSLVKTAKGLTDVPVLAKVSPNWPDLLDCVDACLAAGADGITAIDSLGPALHVDIETGRPALGGRRGYAWLSGAALKPLTVRIVADVCLRHPEATVIATGGVSTAEDMVEMLMVGATAVGAHTAPLLKGVSWFGRTVDRLGRWLDEHGYASPADLRGLALPHLVETDGESHAPLVFTFQAGLCNECGRCVTVCAYEARELVDKEMHLNEDDCRSCGLCVSVCPTGALRCE